MFSVDPVYQYTGRTVYWFQTLPKTVFKTYRILVYGSSRLTVPNFSCLPVFRFDLPNTVFAALPENQYTGGHLPRSVSRNRQRAGHTRPVHRSLRGRLRGFRGPTDGDRPAAGGLVRDGVRRRADLPHDQPGVQVR